MYPIFIFIYSLFITVNAHASFCFDSAFANRTDLTSCTVVGKQNLGCDNNGAGAEYEYITITCNGSPIYDLPVGIDGESTHRTKHLLEDTIGHLNVNATVSCVEVNNEEVSVLCPGNMMNYTMLTCTVSSAPGKTLPEIPSSNICSGADHNGLGLWVVLVLILGLIVF